MRIQKLRWFQACLHAAIQKIDRRIIAIQGACRHTWRIHSQRKVAAGNMWWVHRECTACEAATSEQLDWPLCPTCMKALSESVRLGEKAREAVQKAVVANRYAGMWTYECRTCGSIHVFPVYDDTKKPPSG